MLIYITFNNLIVCFHVVILKINKKFQLYKTLNQHIQIINFETIFMFKCF